LLRKSDELTAACRNYFEQLKDWLMQEEKLLFTNLDIIKGMRLKETTLRRYHKELISVGLLHREKDKKEKSYYYHIGDYKDYELLKQQITTVLDKKLEAIHGTTKRHHSASSKMAEQTTRKSKS
jgi:predicted transcriptional regulator